MSIPLAAGFKALAAGIAVWNPTGGIDVPRVSAVCCQVEFSAKDRSRV
jgi:hypothetical protein